MKLASILFAVLVGIAGAAGDFTKDVSLGGHSHIKVGNHPEHTVSDQWTFTGWIKWNGTYQQTQNSATIITRDNNSAAVEWLLDGALQTQADKARLAMTDSTGFSAKNTTPTPSGTWTFLAGTLQSGNARSYFNANVEGLTASSGDGTTDNIGGTQGVGIGAFSKFMNPVAGANADLADVRIYRRYLKQAELEDIMASYGCDNNLSDLVGRWTMVEGAPGTSMSGITIHDLSETGATGTPSGSTVPDFTDGPGLNCLR